ncbi:BrnA antitoxin family protein [Candidatus Marithrix sp. Canyon 246]|uniref:BrnA antitoxin family protein n=1 Tax=Candidatus Marithrix sp. Canyon 246 TaxID=1827136 RepID=UPI000849F66C|nr:BrnA antitoxin family protein [Candidatus Marithrix sp. Canyon 246]
MREEYDLKTLKVKRRGILPRLEGQSPEQAQVKITITLDDDLVDYFKADSEQLDTKINQTLRQAIQQKLVPSLVDMEKIKKVLLQDSDFISQIAYKISHKT